MFVMSTRHNKLYRFTASLRLVVHFIRSSSKTSHIRILWGIGSVPRYFWWPVFRASPSCPLRSRAILTCFRAAVVYISIKLGRLTKQSAWRQRHLQCADFAELFRSFHCSYTLSSLRSHCDFPLLRLTKCYIYALASINAYIIYEKPT